MMDRFAGLAIDEIERLEGEVQTQRELIAALAGALDRLINNYGDRDAERCPLPLEECSLCNAKAVLERANQPA